MFLIDPPKVENLEVTSGQTFDLPITCPRTYGALFIRKFELIQKKMARSLKIN